MQVAMQMRRLSNLTAQIAGIFRLLGCRHSNMSRPFTLNDEPYRICLECGARVRFDRGTRTKAAPVLLLIFTSFCRTASSDVSGRNNVNTLSPFATSGRDPIFHLCALCVLCVSVVSVFRRFPPRDTEHTEHAQRFGN